MRDAVIPLLLAAMLSGGCGVGSGPTPAPTPGGWTLPPPPPLSQAIPFRGVALRINHPDQLPAYHKRLEQIAAAGADTVLLVVEMHSEAATSNLIYIDMRSAPDQDQLGTLVEHAHKLKLRVGLLPLWILDRQGEQGGAARPVLWEDWFDSYRAAVCFFAGPARTYKIDFMAVGANIGSAQLKLAEWHKTIRAVREIYDGPVTYMANADNYRSALFWDELDMIGIGGQDPAHIPGLIDFSRRLGKPVILLQAYEDSLGAWWGQREAAGLILWGSGDKPPEQVLREWLAKPWRPTTTPAPTGT